MHMPDTHQQRMTCACFQHTVMRTARQAHKDVTPAANIHLIECVGVVVPVQGALLLVLFQVSHTVEHRLTHRAQGSLQTLFDSIPESATLVELGADSEPDMDRQRQVKAADVRLGQTMLVKPGEQVGGAYPVLLHTSDSCPPADLQVC
jgi:cation-transporting P-type ATPase J